MRITQSTIERVLDSDIHAVVSEYVTLKKSGANYCACSPFTNEKTASFYVVPKKNIFKCFSSGNGGGPVKFVMLKEKIEFFEAVLKVASIVNETVEYDEVPANYKEENDLREGLYKINEAAARKYAEQLKAIVDAGLPDADISLLHPAFKEIIGKRKYSNDTIVQWQIGYAPGDTSGWQPNAWKFITNLVGDKSYGGAKEVGLINTKNGHTYDVFRHRIIYPIHDYSGRIVSFGGRALPTTLQQPESDDDFKPAKYINGGESKIYSKETVLYGLHFAGKAIREHGFADLTEGYTDVISMHQAGYNTTVGTCGTALTEKQCALLYRYCKKVRLFYDGDEAGQKATLRAIDLLAQHGFEISVVPMPEFEDKRKVDPDELTRMFQPITL